jgi:uncharacterized membrane-anchored protein YhcB (DUF1043 family)
VSIELWILVVCAASGVSAWIGYWYARKGAPSRSEMEGLQAELAEARETADTVQTGVSAHFEQSAMLFGQLAKDYREFLEHFESSAQALGLSESRARELLQQGYQPLLTHEDAAVEVAETGVPATTGGAEPATTEVATDPTTDLVTDSASVSATDSATNDDAPETSSPQANTGDSMAAEPQSAEAGDAVAASAPLVEVTMPDDESDTGEQLKPTPPAAGKAGP